MIPFPFTARELFLALVLVVPPDEARQLADDIVRGSADPVGWSLSVETLILLSLVSPELNDKVETFRRQYGVPLSAEEWARRRAEMREAVAAGEQER